VLYLHDVAGGLFRHSAFYQPISGAETSLFQDDWLSTHVSVPGQVAVRATDRRRTTIRLETRRRLVHHETGRLRRLSTDARPSHAVRLRDGRVRLRAVRRRSVAGRR